MIDIGVNELFTLEQTTNFVVAIIVLIATIIVDRIVQSAVTRYAKSIRFDTHFENGIKLLVRVAITVGGVVAILRVFNVATDWLISVSAIGGAAIGFASTQTVGNFLARFYLMITRLFVVNNYVRIADIEGEVKEITANYTKIYTPTFHITEIPNR
jgi:small conductance mechanosensitive channel